MSQGKALNETYSKTDIIERILYVSGNNRGKIQERKDVQAWNTTGRTNNQSFPWATWHLYFKTSKLYASTYSCLFPIRQEHPFSWPYTD